MEPIWSATNHAGIVPKNNRTVIMLQGKSWIAGECHTEWSKSDRERQISYDIAYMWNLKKMVQMNLFTKQKYSHRCRKQTYVYQGGKGGRDKLGDWYWHVHTTIYKIDN